MMDAVEFLQVLEDQSQGVTTALLKAHAQSNHSQVCYYEGQLVALAVMRFILTRDFMADADVVDAINTSYEEVLNARFGSNDD